MTATPAGLRGALLPDDDEPLLEVSGATVRYGEALADEDVAIAVHAGEVHALVGENGAGKSSLMRAVMGLVPLSSGEVRMRGHRVVDLSPMRMSELGVGMVHQHFMLVPPFTVAENVVLGDEPILRAPWPAFAQILDEERAAAEARRLATQLGFAGATAEWAHRRTEHLAVGEQQRLEILKAMRRGARVLILDEPTAVLTPPEVAQLFGVLRQLRDEGAGVLLCTHKLDEVVAIADRVTVLRRGKVVARFDAAEEPLDAAGIAAAMVGRSVMPPPERGVVAPGAVRLEAEGLCAEVPGGARLVDVRLRVLGGEILGIAGVEGNGQAELAAALVGTLAATAGRVLLDGADVTRATPAARRRKGLACVPEDRNAQGLLVERSITDNLLLGREERFVRGGALGLLGVIDRARLDEDAAALVARFDVQPADPRLPVRALSGGNRQKVVLARELSRAPGVLVAAQPTRGVDVGAIERIHRELDGVRRAGGAVLLISAELDELLALCDRIAVLYRGRLVATLSRSDATRERLGLLMTGASTVGTESGMSA